MDFFPENIKEAASKVTSDWLKGADFDGEGQTLQLVKTLGVVKSQYGAEEKDWLVQNELLQEGESFRYVFKDVAGVEKKIDSSSTPFFIGFKQCEGLTIGDWISIVRTGSTTKTRYTVTKVEEPVAQEKTEEESIDPSSIPF